MAAIPDRFDLWVRKARQEAVPERQVDLLLGSLFALRDWYFLNRESEDRPEPAMVDLQGETHLLVFSEAGRVNDFAEESGLCQCGDRAEFFSVPALKAAEYCRRFRAVGAAGILVNPGDHAFAVTLDGLEEFDRQWRERGARAGEGFWIPNMTSEEEDFWQEHGL